MEAFFEDGVAWWVSAIELPALAGLLALVMHQRELMAQEKLEAMRNFASIAAVRELEQRLASHLLRIEAKLDATALKAEALTGRER
ncbi:MAG: hypothetical protein H6865_05345 [Rhodospirillales bacterium]|nr:hypothetical protein [Alphaproteobacteria bacterium]MCB9987044.1 hypothetical protein [Rhodospirillales bacterium]USO08571.1 MAG: hypothetical protein H6866_02945 [Rhodospirillales bacterium]